MPLLRITLPAQIRLLASVCLLLLASWGWAVYQILHDTPSSDVPVGVSIAFMTPFFLLPFLGAGLLLLVQRLRSQHANLILLPIAAFFVYASLLLLALVAVLWLGYMRTAPPFSSMLIMFGYGFCILTPCWLLFTDQVAEPGSVSK